MKLSTELHKRVLRFDGISIAEPDDIGRLMMLGIPPSKLRVQGTSSQITQFNENVPTQDVILLNLDEALTLSQEWLLPPDYKDLDLDQCVHTAFISFLSKSDYSDDEVNQASLRLVDELIEINRRGMVEFTKTIIFVLHTFRKKNIVWGVGRGSSCASYVLFILGLHVVDCVRLNVPMEEFFHD